MRATSTSDQKPWSRRTRYSLLANPGAVKVSRTSSLLETAIAIAERVETGRAAREPRQGRRRGDAKRARKSSPVASRKKPAPRAVLPMPLQIGDRITNETGGRPYTTAGGEDCSRARPEGPPTRQRGPATDDGRGYVILDRDEERGDHASCCSRVASSRCSSGPCSSGSRRSRSPTPPTLLGWRATGMMTISTTLSSPSLPRPPSRRRHPSIPSSRYGCLWRASRCRNKKPTERRVAPPPLLVLLP